MARTAVTSVLLSVFVAAGLLRPPQQTADSNEALDAFGRSLALRADRVVVDSTHTAMLWLAQNAPVPYTSQGALRLTLALRVSGADSRLVKPLGTVRIFGGSVADQQFPVSVDLQGVPDGDYQYTAELQDDGTPAQKRAVGMIEL